jgi:putative glutamine amidotransferase
MWWFNRFAVWRSGGRAVRVTPERTHPIADLDGLVVGGGDDIGLTIEEHITPAVRIDRARDALEVAALRDAEACSLPVLGICRGAQMINVARGGSLHEDVYESYTDAKHVRTVLPAKLVTIDADSRLAEILRVKYLRVNALHHQSVDRLGDGLRIVARDRYGIVQAIEADGPRLVLGVQWHPEFLVFNRAQIRLFRELVLAARSRQHRRQASAGEVLAAD